MNDEIRKATALKVYNDICKALDNDGWTYTKKEDQLKIYTSAKGDDVTVGAVIVVLGNIQRIQAYAQFPFTVAEDKRVDMAVALAHLQSKLVYGGFDYDITTGSLYYNIGNTYKGAVLSQEAISLLIGLLCFTVNKFYAKLLALSKGFVSVSDILKEG